MTSNTASSKSSTSSAKESLGKALRESHFRSGKEFNILSELSQTAVAEYGPPVRSRSHDKNNPFADRTPIRARKSSLPGSRVDRDKLKIEGKIELGALRDTILKNEYLTKKQIKAIKNNVWEYPVLYFIQQNAPVWIHKELTIRDILHHIPAEKLEILFSTTWARYFIEIDPVGIFEQLDRSWTTIRNFIQQLDDLKKIKFRDDLTDHLLSFYQYNTLRMDFSIQYTLDNLVEIIENIISVQELNILTTDGSLIQSEIQFFSKRAIDLLFLKKYGAVFKLVITDCPVIKEELVLLAKTDLTDPQYAQRMMQLEQLLILCSKGDYTRWILENRVLHLQDLWNLTNSGAYTTLHEKACKRIYLYYKGVLEDHPLKYKKYCRDFRQRLRNDKNAFTLLGQNKIDITDIIMARNK